MYYMIEHQMHKSDVRVSVHRDKFLIREPTRSTNFSKVFILEWNSTCFGQFLCPSSGVFHCAHSNGICYMVCWQFASRIRMEQSSILILLASCPQTCMTNTIAVCTMENAWWWTEKLSETSRVSFQNKHFWEISASIWFYYKKHQMHISNMFN